MRDALDEIGYLRNADKIDAEKLMRHVKAVGGWYMADEEQTIDADTVMTAMAAMTDPRSEFYDLVRQQSLPADELMGQRMQTGVLAVLGQLTRHPQLDADRPGVVAGRRAGDRARRRRVGLLRGQGREARAQVRPALYPG